jgi:hypothetical protein
MTRTVRTIGMAGAIAAVWCGSLATIVAAVALGGLARTSRAQETAPCQSEGIIQVTAPGTSNTPGDGTISIVDDNEFSGGYITGPYVGFRITGSQDATIDGATGTADLTGTRTATDPAGTGWFTLRFEGEVSLATGSGSAEFIVVDASPAYDGLIGSTGSVEATQIASGPTTFSITDFGLC